MSLRIARTAAAVVCLVLGCGTDPPPQPNVEPSASDQSPSLAVPELPELPPLPAISELDDLPSLEPVTLPLTERPLEIAVADDGAIWTLEPDGRTLRRLRGRKLVRVVELAERGPHSSRPNPRTPNLLLTDGDEELEVTPTGEVTRSVKRSPRYRYPEGTDATVVMGEELWSVGSRPGRLVRGSSEQTESVHWLDRETSSIEQVVALEDRLLVVGDGRLFTIGADGRTRDVAETTRDIIPRHRSRERDILVRGSRVVWAERQGDEARLQVVHLHGGASQTVARAPYFEGLLLGDVHRGRAAIIVGGLWSNAKTSPHLRVFSLPEVHAEPASVPPDPRRSLRELPIGDAALAQVVSWGVRSAAELFHRCDQAVRATGDLHDPLEALPPAIWTEIKYANQVFLFNHRAPGPLPPARIDPVYLESVRTLELPAPLTNRLIEAKLPTLGLLGSLAQSGLLTSERLQPDASRLPPIATEAEAAAIERAFAARGMEFEVLLHERRLTEAGEKP